MSKLRYLIPLVLGYILAVRYGVPDGTLAGICQELIAGSTQGRQALVGSCWHAPLPTLIYLPFAWLCSPTTAAQLAAIALWWFYVATVSGLLTGLVGWSICGMKVGKRIINSPTHLVKAASCAALLLLCGIYFLVPIALTLVLLPFVALFHEETRRRFFAWVLLGWLPTLYAVGVWMLMNMLVLGDAIFCFRSVRMETLMQMRQDREVPAPWEISDHQVVDADHQPLRDLPPAEILSNVAACVQAETPYGRVFVEGYEGLRLLEGNQNPMFTSNMDLHIADLKYAYKGQRLFLLLPRPYFLTRIESVYWRYPKIYKLGLERVIFLKDFGAWRLFEVVQAPTREQLDEWGDR
ncbi:MAG: hypothetical protein IKR48_04625 [Kiritimatiellae bacterium]|nr:hypothetical protein [Kiritimatiellia bacterium]